MAADGESAPAAPLLLPAEQRPPRVAGCPGCVQERKNEAQRGVPIVAFFHIWAITLCGSLPVSSLFPYLYFMVRDLNVAKRAEDIGYYAGFVGASFLIGRTLSSTLWGIVADHHGRKPVIVYSVASVIIFNTLFGFSTNYWLALVIRFLLGALNGLLVPIRAYAVEVCRAEYHAQALGLVSSGWAVGLIIGPAIGGYLAQPAEKYPEVFANDSLFARFPYLLPNIPITLFAVLVLVSCTWLPETLHNHKDMGDEDAKIDIAEEGAKRSGAQLSLFKNWPLISSIILYCILSLHDMAYIEIFPLWAESDKKFGGLNYSSEDVGQVLSVTGFGLLFYQVFLFNWAIRSIGTINLCRLSAALTITLLFFYPLMAQLSGLTLAVAVNVASLLRCIFAGSMFTSSFILQNNSVGQEQRGAANGLSMTAGSIFKAIGPAGGGALLSWAQKHQQDLFIPGNEIVFLVLNVIMGICLAWTFRPFLVEPCQEKQPASGGPEGEP